MFFELSPIISNSQACCLMDSYCFRPKTKVFHSVSEQSPVTNGFSGQYQQPSSVRQQVVQPTSVRQQVVRQRHNYTTLESSRSNEDFTNIDTATGQNVEPLIIPVESLHDMPSSSNPSSTRSNDGSSSVRSRRSQQSGSPVAEDRISQRSGGQVESPRSEDSRSQEASPQLPSSPRSKASSDSDNNIDFEADFGDPDDFRL